MLICSQDGTDHLCLYGKLGREGGLRCGQPFCGFLGPHPVHGHLTAALLAVMQDVRGSAIFEKSETEFRCTRPALSHSGGMSSNARALERGVRSGSCSSPLSPSQHHRLSRHKPFFRAVRLSVAAPFSLFLEAAQ